MAVDLDELEAKSKAAQENPGYAPESHEDSDGSWHYRSNSTEERDAFQNAANPAVVLELLARLRAVMGVVRDLAAFDSRAFEMQYDHGNPACVMCDWGRDGSNEGRDHAESCPYRRAVELQRQEVER